MRTVQLSDFVSLRRGASYKGALVGEEGVPLLGLGTIAKHGGFKASGVRRYDGDAPDRMLVRSGDLYVSLKDMTQEAALLGAVARVPSCIAVGRLTQDTIALDFDADFGVDRDYVYWVLRGPRFRAYCRNLGTGTTNLDLSQRDFLSFEMVLPDLYAQNAVVRVLSALDDKIAANRSVIGGGLELLDSRFDYARASVGKRTISELAQVVLGGTPSRKVDDYWGGDVPWINSGACNRRIIFSASEMITRDGLEKSAAKILPAGTTCVAITGATLGQMGWLASPMAANQSVVGVVALPEDRLWVHFAVRAEREQLLGWATGGAQQHVNKNSVGSIAVSYDSVCAKNFGNVNRSLMERVVLAEDENEILAATRDQLLPLLMSGRITVKDAEKTVEEVV